VSVDIFEEMYFAVFLDDGGSVENPFRDGLLEVHPVGFRRRSSRSGPHGRIWLQSSPVSLCLQRALRTERRCATLCGVIPPRRALSWERTDSVWGAKEIWLEFSLAKNSAQAKSTRGMQS